MSLYETDYVEWSKRTAELIRSGRLSEVDLDNVAEEIESLGRSDWRQLRNRVRVLLLHLLKSDAAPEVQSGSWRATVMEQRTRIRQLLEDSPSLRASLPEVIAANYGPAVELAALQMNRDVSAFPPQCPYTTGHVLGAGTTP